MLRCIMLLNVLLHIFILNGSTGIILTHPDFQPFESTTIDRYKVKESECEKFQFNDKQRCPCGRDKLNKMALVYLDRMAEENDGQKVKQAVRFLVSIEAMGIGGFSKAYHATPITDTNATKKCVAIKIAASQTLGVEELEREAIALNELSKSSNKHIIKFIDIFSYENGAEMLAIILELGDMNLNAYFRQLVQKGNIAEKKFHGILKQMLLGLEEVHNAGYIYFDMKPENMLTMPYPEIGPGKKRLADQVYLKFIDFAGSAKVTTPGGAMKIDAHLIHFTERYKAPEISGRDRSKYTQAHDIWTFGISIISLLSKTKIFQKHFNNSRLHKEAFKGDRPYENQKIKDIEATIKWDQVFKILALKVIAEKNSRSYPLIKKLADSLRKHFPNSMGIVQQCLVKEPEKRPSAEQLLLANKNIFEEINLSNIYNSSGDDSATATAETSAAGASSSREYFLEQIRSRIAHRESVAPPPLPKPASPTQSQKLHQIRESAKAVCGIQECPQHDQLGKRSNQSRAGSFTIGKHFLPYAQVVSDNLLRLNEETSDEDNNNNNDDGDNPRMALFKMLVTLNNVQRRLVIADYCRRKLSKNNIVLPLIISPKYGGSNGIHADSAKNAVIYSNDCVDSMFSGKSGETGFSQLRMGQNFGQLIRAMVEPTYVYLAQQLHREIWILHSTTPVHLDFIFEAILTLDPTELLDLINAYLQLFGHSLGSALQEFARRRNFPMIKYGKIKAELMEMDCAKLIGTIGQYLEANVNNHEPIRALKQFLIENGREANSSAAAAAEVTNAQHKSIGQKIFKIFRPKQKSPSKKQIQAIVANLVVMLNFGNSREIMDIPESGVINWMDGDGVQEHFAQRVLNALKRKDYHNLTRILITRSEVDLRLVAKRLNGEKESRTFVREEIGKIGDRDFAKAVGNLLFVVEYNEWKKLGTKKQKTFFTENWYENLCETERIGYFCSKLDYFELHRLDEEMHLVESLYDKHLIDQAVTKEPITSENEDLDEDEEANCNEYIYMLQIRRHEGEEQWRSKCIVHVLAYLYRKAEKVCGKDFLLFEQNGWRQEVRDVCGTHAGTFFQKKKEMEIAEMMRRENEDEEEEEEAWNMKGKMAANLPTDVLNHPSNSALDQTLDTYLDVEGNNSSGNGRDLMGTGGITTISGRPTSSASHSSTFATEEAKKEKKILYEIEEMDID